MVDFGCQSGVPGDLPLPPQPVLQAYFVLNASRYRRPGSARGRRLGVDDARAFGTAYGRLEEDPLFMPGTRFTLGVGTNGKGAAGSGRFRVSEQVWRREV